ncbi:MAG: PKD domain-containing protein [Candidatus Aminicenantes bacterium]|nr:PKD domain-containing protein [Candidatus Aminicenantes bacterium]
MKRLNRLVLIMCAFLTVLSLPDLSAQVIPLTNSSRQAEMPFVLVLPSGDILVMYNEGESFNGDASIYYLRYSQSKQSWSNAKLAVPTRNSAAYAQLALDKNGIVHMSYFDGNASANRDIFYATYNPAADTWTNGKLVYESPGLNSSWSRIRVEDDKIYIVWTHNYDPAQGLTDIVMVVNDIGGSWPVPKANRITISHTGQSASVHNFFDVKNKNIYCTWIDDNHHPGNWAIYYNEGKYSNATGTWNFDTTPAYLFQLGVNQYYPALAVDDTGTPHIIFSFKNGPFFHTRKTGNSWTSPQAISQGQCQINFIAFMTYKQGLLHTAWVETTPEGESMFYGRGLPDGTWAEPIKISNAVMPGYPGVDVGEDGTVHVVYSDGESDAHRNIKYSAIALPGNPPAASLVVSSSGGLVPFTVNFDASGSTDSDGNIIDHRWDFGDGSSAKGAVVSHTYTQTGKYTVLLSVIDNDLRVGMAKTTIVASDGDPIALFELSANTGMAPFSVTCDASGSVDVDGSLVSYDWDFGDWTTGSGSVVTHSYETGGTFNVSLTVTDNEGKTDMTIKPILVFEKPKASFTVSSDFGKQPLKVTFDGSASTDSDGTIASYLWDFGNGLTGQGKTINHTYSTPGEFLSILTVIDNDGYTATATKTITVSQAPSAPLNVSVEILANKSLIHTEYINRVSWTENPQNTGAYTVTTYKIYRKAKGASVDLYASVGESNAAALWFDDRHFPSSQDAKNYDYAVTAIDNEGRESTLVNTTGMGFFNNLMTKIKRQLIF